MIMSGKQRTTIRDVAAAAGVSVTTVSDALSGKGRLPEETRRKVRAAADRLGYRPSAIALGLRDRGLGLVGLCIVPAGEAMLTGVEYWATIVTHASQTLLSEGLAPVLLPHSVDLLSRLKIPLDGVIVVDPLKNDPVLTFFEKTKIRYFTIGRDLGRDNQSWVDDDIAKGMERLLEQTLAPGTDLAFVTIGPEKSYVADTLSGMQHWASVNRSAIKIHHCKNTERRNIDAVVGRAVEEGAKAIVAQHDRLALPLLAALKVRKLQNEVRLLSATDSPEFEQVLPPVSAIRLHPTQLADKAARAVIDMIRGRSDQKKTFLVVETVVR